MPQILVRHLEADVVNWLKDSAHRHGRSLQSEAKQILEQSARFSFARSQEIAHQWQKKLADRHFEDSTEIIREDRLR